jgi:hypothetical protein
MPKKPTDPFGAWIFSKDGKVSRDSSMLPDDKQGQECAVIARFIEGYNESQDSQIESSYVELEERDHDFEIEKQNKTIVVQVTEIIERDYVIDKGASPTPGATEGVIRFKLGSRHSQEIDVIKRNRALETAIKRKVEKHYAKPANEFWLLVFTTDVGIFPEVSDTEFMELPTPLEYAQEYLKGVTTPFDQIWFVNMYDGAPLMIWDS